MLHGATLSIPLLGLALFLLGPACEASSLGLTVHVLPLASDGGKTVRAHFSAIAASPCPALSGLCAAGEDCLVHPTSSPFQGFEPKPGWCVRQWQKTIPSNYNASISLGSKTEIYVSVKAGQVVQVNSGRINHPPFVALPPPLRAQVNCSRHFYLSVKDLDGDRVQCRFAQPDKGECMNCTQHSFIELDEEKCLLTFTGEAPAGQYFIYLMAEDLIPMFRTSPVTEKTPLSSVPVHLSLTVEESTSSCSDEPVATSETPRQDSTLFVLPYQEVKFDVGFNTRLESVSEVAVVGPPDLHRARFKSIGPLSAMTMAWVRSENKLAPLLPICFVGNTKSFQSEPRCLWLHQREMSTLPAGTELKCENTQMTLVLPVASLTNINLDELQLNSPTCPITYNNTHLIAHISLNGCGTKTVQSGSELVYTNTLQSVRPFKMVSRNPSLVLPLACRIPRAQVRGPKFSITIPTERELFGPVAFWIEFHIPGEGPLANFTRIPRFRSIAIPPGRVRRAVGSPSESKGSFTSSSNHSFVRQGSELKVKQLDLHVMSNCSLHQAEMVVTSCLESETEDFAETSPILQQGCAVSNNTVEIITVRNNSKVYRLDLSKQESQSSVMYVQCTVNLCIATTPSQRCPDVCRDAFQHKTIVDSIFTKSYTIRSRPVSLILQPTAQPTNINTTGTGSTAPVTNTSAVQDSTTSHASQLASSMAAGVILASISIFLQNILLPTGCWTVICFNIRKW
ncbi:uncharacterized protein LOC115041109 [Echeneis naucrates]|uniref:uncharacterized protein LOC115041109 n=1 Tax=Echeneis naucrates TaxID=173247 RepID=UPI001113DF7C|nr:uncharacterized protein LOC115041109 [Echeneis naucrates]